MSFSTVLLTLCCSWMLCQWKLCCLSSSLLLYFSEKISHERCCRETASHESNVLFLASIQFCLLSSLHAFFKVWQFALSFSLSIWNVACKINFLSSFFWLHPTLPYSLNSQRDHGPFIRHSSSDSMCSWLHLMRDSAYTWLKTLQFCKFRSLVDVRERVGERKGGKTSGKETSFCTMMLTKRVTFSFWLHRQMMFERSKLWKWQPKWQPIPQKRRSCFSISSSKVYSLPSL